MMVTEAGAVVDVRGFVAAGGAQTDAATSWRSGDGFGVLDLGKSGGETTEARGDAQLVVDAAWELGERTSLGGFLHVLGRAEPASVVGERAGIVEAYLEADWRLRDSDQLRIQLGLFILPTSRENVSWAWSSPYTLTFSAINTWIGEEVRPTGLLLEYRAAAGHADELRFGATAFGGNDTAGALLAWRGWALSDRLTVWDEVLPLPPAPSLAEGGLFSIQRDDGTLPMGPDLDHRVGYAGWLSWSREERLFFQMSYYDNQADRSLWPPIPSDEEEEEYEYEYQFEYAWRTTFLHAAAEVHFGPVTLASEWINGTTGMGHSDLHRVDVDINAFYALASFLTDPWVGGTWRFTTRWDEFKTRDVDTLQQDDNDSRGDAFTAAVFWESESRPLRLGLEYLHVDSTRDAAADAGYSPQVGGEQIRLELRYFFGE